MNFEKYKNTLLFPKKPIKPKLAKDHNLDGLESYKVAFEAWQRDMERYDELLKEYRAESRMLQSQFRRDAIDEAGLTDHPKAEMAFNMALEFEPLEFIEDVFSYLDDLGELLNASRENKMFIDDLNLRQCYDLGYAIDKHPVKIAGILFPHRPPMYVQITKLIKKYLYP